MKNSTFTNCRTCYKHIGGIYATHFFSLLIEEKYIRFTDISHFNNSRKRLPMEITEKGQEFLSTLGDIPMPFGSVFACLDGTERTPHLAGKFADSLLNFLLINKYIIKTKNSRILEISTEGIMFLTNGMWSNQMENQNA